MKQEEIEATLSGIMDVLGSIEHERWAHWQKYMHGRAHVQSDGSLLIPADLVQQWECQIATPFADLTETEKESDLEQVRRYLPTIVAALSSDGK